MSEFARGVLGVFAVGMVVGVGTLMLIPQSSSSATRFAEPLARPCSQQIWPATDRICQKWTEPRHGDARPAGADKSGEAALLETTPQQANGRSGAPLESAGQRFGGQDNKPAGGRLAKNTNAQPRR